MQDVKMGIHRYSILITAVIVVTSILPMVFPAPTPVEQQQWKWEPYGPRVDQILMPVILDYDARLMAFKKGDVDTNFIQPTRVPEVKDDPNIYLLTYQTFNLQFLGINCQQYPWNYTAIRKAVAHLIDRDWIIRNVFNGFGVPVESAIPPAFGDWSNPNVPSYPYSKELAKKVLLDAGFTYDEKTGKWYEPNGRELGKIIIQVPPQEQAPWLYQEALHIIEDGRSIGLPMEIESIEFQALVSQIYSKTFKSFILYLGWGRVPTLAYELFRTGGTWNFWGISDPEIDKLLEEFYFTTDIAKAKQALWKVQEKVAQILPYIPIYMGLANVGFRTDIVGIVLNQPLGGQSYLTTLNVHHIGEPFGGTYRTPLGSDPRTLNPFTAISGDEWAVMNNILETLFIAHPDSVSDNLPWLAGSWEIEEISFNGHPATKITFYLNNNVTWQDGVKFLAKDVNFTWWFIKVNKPTQQYAMVFEKLIRTEVPNDYTIVAYINGTSWTYLYNLNVAIVPMHIWSNETLLAQYGGWEKWDPSKVPHPTVKGLTCLIGTGPFIFADRKQGEYILLRWYSNYWRRHPEKTISLDAQASAHTLYAGDPFTITTTVKDYTGTALANATVTVQLTRDGNVVKTVTATHVGSGVYQATIDTSGLEGNFDVWVSGSATVGGGSFNKTVSVKVTIRPAWERYLPFIASGIIVVIVAVAAFLFLKRRSPKQVKSE
ncbi:MAG: ABC transporter substrate-binding protein [Thermofilaceae archaeon]